MEFEKKRKRPLGYYCVVGITIVVWFVLVFYVALMKIDAEHSKGLIEIEGVFQPWKMVREFSKEDQVKRIDWLPFKSLGKEVVEVNVVSDKNNKIKYTNMKSISAFLASKEKHPIRNWLVNSLHGNNTSGNATKAHLMKYLLIRTMRQKIIDRYGDTLILPINDSSYIKVRSWRFLTIPVNEKIYLDDLPNKTTRNKVHRVTPIQRKIVKISTLPLTPLSTNTKLPTINITKSERTAHLRSELQSVNKNKLSSKLGEKFRADREFEKVERLEYASTTTIGDQTDADAYKEVKNSSEAHEEIEHSPPADPDPVAWKSDRNSIKFELSLNETTLLTSRSEDIDEYVDTTSEKNVKNEIGPISKYVDGVLADDTKHQRLSIWNVWDKHVESNVDQYETNDFSISVAHRKPHVEGLNDIKGKRVSAETRPADAEIVPSAAKIKRTVLTSGTDRKSKVMKRKHAVNSSEQNNTKFQEVRITKQAVHEINVKRDR